MNEGISLYDLQKKIKENISSSFTHLYWVRGEIAGMKNNVTGHCYMDLVDKDTGSDGIRARAQAIIWSSTWRMLRPYFENSTGAVLSEGMNILVKVQVQYTELYGLSLMVYDIDPSFSVGEIELERRKIIQRLKEDGMFEMNATLELPILPGRFAIISSPTAAGYRDFMKHLHENEYGFSFYTRLFESPMQGNSAPEGIISALEAIQELCDNGEERFDAVLVLRGGGSSADLSCFDDYDLAVNIAQYPLPVMVAVGHDQDFHICDMVACVSVKTPTALADYIVDIYVGEDAMISSFVSRLSLAMANKYSAELNRISMLEQRVVKGNPISLLDGGYSIAEKGGKRVDSVVSLTEGDIVKIVLKDGSADCKVIKIIKNR